MGHPSYSCRVRKCIFDGVLFFCYTSTHQFFFLKFELTLNANNSPLESRTPKKYYIFGNLRTSAFLDNPPPLVVVTATVNNKMILFTITDTLAASLSAIKLQHLSKMPCLVSHSLLLGSIYLININCCEKVEEAENIGSLISLTIFQFLL